MLVLQLGCMKCLIVKLKKKSVKLMMAYTSAGYTYAALIRTFHLFSCGNLNLKIF